MIKHSGFISLFAKTMRIYLAIKVFVYDGPVIFEFEDFTRLLTSCNFIFLVQLVEQFSNIWHHGRVRRYLTSEDYPGPESKGKPWYGLLMLLRKYPEHFVINTRSKGRITLEFVSLVSLLS